MKLIVSLLLIGVSAGALAAPPPAPETPGGTVTLSCTLRHSAPRGTHTPKPFSQHFKVDMQAKTVDGVPATVTADRIGWEPTQTYLRPYATLSLPAWQFHASGHTGHQSDPITGSCKPVG